MQGKLMSEEKIKLILKKYPISVNYGEIYSKVDSLIREYNYFSETYHRLTQDESISLSPKVDSMPFVLRYNDLFSDEYFNYNLRHNKHHRDEMEDYYSMVIFIDEYFYIDNTWELQQVKLLEEIIGDEDVTYVCKTILGKKPCELVRESSYYYADDVWEYVNEHKLLPYMKQKGKPNED